MLCSVAHAQSVRWEVDPNSSSSVSLVFEDCAPDGQPDLPAIQGVTLSFAGQSQNMSMVNGSFSRSVTLSYLVRGRVGGAAQIPAFTVKTNRGTLRVAPFNLAAPNTSLDSVASSRLMPERTSIWAGEVFGLTYELSAARRSNPQVNQSFDWVAAPLVAEDWSKPEVTEGTVNGERRLQVVFRTRAVAKTPNTLRLEAASHLLNVQTGTVGFGFLSQPRMEPVSVTSDQPVIDVRPLPPSPTGFTGAVGNFKLVSKVVPEKAAVGEPVTWTLELNGTGNWPDIAGLPAREVSNDFQVVQPKAKRTPAEGKLFDVALAEDVVLVPTKAGSYNLGPISFIYFDPKAGSYRTITAPRTTVTITPPSAPQFNVTPPASGTGQPPDTEPGQRDAETSHSGIRGSVTPPPPPAGIPRDPLPGLAAAPLPLSLPAVIVGTAAPFVALLLFWLGLAIRRAQQTDPVRPRREARHRLMKTRAKLAHADDADGRSLLLAWQHDTAVLWQIPHAAPPAKSLPDEKWAALWSEADRALYGDKAPLPADWVARAQEAAVMKAVPGFKPWRLFLRQNLLPFAAGLAVGVALLVHAGAAESTARKDPLAAYQSADFATAETLWRARISGTPTDWIARHNLALALAQQDRPGESAAQAAAAFVQHPRNPSVQWHFRLAAERAGFVPADLGVFLTEGPVATLASMTSPARWQWVVIAGAMVVALALAVMLANAYGKRRRMVYSSAATFVLVGILTGSAGAAGWRAYGLTADTAAVIVPRPGTLRSIPTEADTAQKTTQLAAGSVAVADKTFLGWSRLAFPNGQTGWVRTEELVPIWK